MQLSSLSKFEVRRIHRSEVTEFPFNPRMISEDAKVRLRAVLEQVGLVSPAICINTVTGKMLSGHQRLATMDACADDPDYELSASFAAVPEELHAAQVVFFNNPNSMGQWDGDKLLGMLRRDELDIDMSGFQPDDLRVLLQGYTSSEEIDLQLLRLMGSDDVNPIIPVEPEPTPAQTSEPTKTAEEKLDEAPKEHNIIVVFPNATALDTTLLAASRSRHERYFTWKEFRKLLEQQLFRDTCKSFQDNP